jgi:hypothetical protein
MCEYHFPCVSTSDSVPISVEQWSRHQTNYEQGAVDTRKVVEAVCVGNCNVVSISRVSTGLLFALSVPGHVSCNMRWDARIVLSVTQCPVECHNGYGLPKRLLAENEEAVVRTRSVRCRNGCNNMSSVGVARTKAV